MQLFRRSVSVSVWVCVYFSSIILLFAVVVVDHKHECMWHLLFIFLIVLRIFQSEDAMHMKM